MTGYSFPDFPETFPLRPPLPDRDAQNRSIRRGRFPHHITQRGNRCQTVFTDPDDQRVYLDLLQEYADEGRLQIWAWCLMSNHIHLLAVPETTATLARALGHTHRDFARYRNVRSGHTGHLWQARYYSCPVDAAGVWPVMAYIERNPVRAGLVEFAEDYPWSSARAHVVDRDERGFLDMAHWRSTYPPERWREALRTGVEEEALRDRIRLATRTGRPFGSGEFIQQLERTAKRHLQPRRAGRPKKPEPGDARQEVLRVASKIGE